MTTLSQQPKQQLSRDARLTDCKQIDFIWNPLFETVDPDAFWQTETQRKDENRQDRRSVKRGQASQFGSIFDAPLLTHSEEQDLFYRMNYLKYRASVIQDRLDGETPAPEVAQQLSAMLARATYLRNLIVESNTRLVISIVKTLVDENNTLDDLLSEGLSCMMNAVDKFDFDRGFRFSTYATLAVRRDIYRLVQRAQRSRSRFSTGSNEVLEDQVMADAASTRTESALMKLHHCLAKILPKLDDREQFIVKARYGLIDLGVKPTFAKLGENLGVSKERVRQLELRAMSKLRGFIDDHKADLSGLA